MSAQNGQIDTSAANLAMVLKIINLLKILRFSKFPSKILNFFKSLSSSPVAKNSKYGNTVSKHGYTVLKYSFDELLWCENYEKLASRSEIVGGSARHLS